MKLGDTLKDKYSDAQGVAMTQVSTISGMEYFDIVGKDKDGEPKAWALDEVQLELIESAAIDATPTPTGKIAIGMRVQDIATDWKGTVVTEALYLNGCVRYSVRGQGKDGVPHEEYLHEALLQPINDAPIVEPLSPPRRGGSSSRFSSL